MLKGFLFVGLGGAAGSMARYGIGMLMGKFIQQPYPHATFLINIIGCFFIGILFGFGNKYNIIPGAWWLVLATGFCGGFTTFSSFALENVTLMRGGQNITAFLYTMLSVIIGLLLCRLGIALVK
jgi:CrcB protein